MINEFNRTFTEVAVMHILVFILIFVVGSIIAAYDGDYSGIAAIGKFVGFFVLLFAVLWLSFARQQAEFYRNSGHYITNLQIDIKEIDAEIENILLETEDANCNVAQGYKVFKRLKELRLKKKAKTKELNCLYVLTDYIDCESLADTCEDNLAEIEDIMEVSEHSEVTKM